MTTNKKDVHRTGALASILSQSDIQPVDVTLQKKQESHQSTIQVIEPSLLSSIQTKQKSGSLIEISPLHCKPWNFSDRNEAELGNIEELANSIQTAGQQEPALVRPIKDTHLSIEPSIKYEIIFGNRRWRACKLIGKNLLAIIRELTDQEAALAQKEENENRADISDYAKAMSYKKLIDAKVFSNENQLALKLNIPRNRINDLMSYTRIPKQLLEAIPNIHHLPQRTAIKLASLSKNQENLEALILLASKIGANKITSGAMEKTLIEIKNGKFDSVSKKNIPIIGKGGAEIFTIREDSNGAPCIVLHKASRQVIDMNKLKILLKDYIDKCIENNFSAESTKLSGA